jgi:hypothetical protein
MIEHNYSDREFLELSTTDDPATFPEGTVPVGTMRWTFKAPLSDGRVLKLSMGKKGRQSLLDILYQESSDDDDDAEFLNQ